jgi:hypothetical protein
MMHSRSSSLHTALEESSDEDGAALGAWGESCIRRLPRVHVVIPTDPINATPAPENTPALQTIPAVTVLTVVPQPRMELLPNQQQANQED